MHAPIRSSLISLSVTMLVVTAILIVGSAGVFNMRFLPINDNSLAPILRNGDAVIASRVDARTLSPGDIVSYVPSSVQTQAVTARVAGSVPGQQNVTVINHASSVTKVDDSAIIGRVNVRLAGVGYAIHFVQTIPGMLVGLYAPALLIVVVELKRLFAYYDKRVYRLSGYTSR